ncbi:hypothetical protein [Amycolatopsis nigrescens]|uniref:hypothetical protein n=1 Tax=Amycolatopsis nigrescens TaxID=381445 RepID=UPI000363EE20|nr:hypothetical protein [Amycolatopsis nigrescens]
MKTPLELYPELRRVFDLKEAGWSFVPTVDDNGEVTKLTGLYVWPDGVADALHIGSQTDAGALRMDHTGGLLWQCDGTLAEVTDALLALPAPSSPLAPRLVLGSAPTLWTP